MVTSVTSSSLRVIASSIGWWGKADSNGGPKATGLQPESCAPQVTLPHDLEPSRGFEPRSARYRRAALPLSYDGVADRIGHDPNTQKGTHCLAGRHGNLAVCAVLLVWRSAEESNPLPIRYPSQFSGLVADHSAGTLLLELVRAEGFEPTLPTV